MNKPNLRLQRNRNIEVFRLHSIRVLVSYDSFPSLVQWFLGFFETTTIALNVHNDFCPSTMDYHAWKKKQMSRDLPIHISETLTKEKAKNKTKNCCMLKVINVILQAIHSPQCTKTYLGN